MSGASEQTEVFFDGVARYALVRDLDGRGASATGGGRRLTPLEARWVLGRLLGVGSGAEVVRAYRTVLRGPLFLTDEGDVQRMRDALLDAIERGHLAIFETRIVTSAKAREADEAPASAAAVSEEKKTWIGIVLVDDADPPAPVAFAAYKVELPDGSTREGMLDEHGQARLDGIDPGTCKVSFPGFDRRDWS